MSFSPTVEEMLRPTKTEPNIYCILDYPGNLFGIRIRVPLAWDQTFKEWKYEDCLHTILASWFEKYPHLFIFTNSILPPTPAAGAEQRSEFDKDFPTVEQYITRNASLSAAGAEGEGEIPYGMEIKPWDSLRLIGQPNERFEELIEKGWDWRSFYNGWLEGRSKMLNEVLLDNSTIRSHAQTLIAALEAERDDYRKVLEEYANRMKHGNIAEIVLAKYPSPDKSTP